MLHLIDETSSESGEDVESSTSSSMDGTMEGRQEEVHAGVGHPRSDQTVDRIADQLINLDIGLSKPENVRNSRGERHDVDGMRGDTSTGETRTDKIPQHVEERLFDHQRIGLRWLLDLYRIPSGGILADDMGLGKTLQVTAFAASLLKGKMAKRVIVLAPKTLLPAWKKEVEICEVSHITFEYGGDKKTRASIMDRIVREGGILVTTYGMLQHNAQQLREHGCHDEDDGDLWDLMIMDEGHKLKNTRAQLRQKIDSIPAKMRLIITGTPIQNNLLELHSLFTLVCPNLLGSLKEFQEQFAKPIVRGTDRNATQRERENAAIVSESLRKTYAPFMLRRTKEGVFHGMGETSANDEVASKSPIFFSKKKDLVVWLRLTKNQERLYRAFLESKSVAAVLNKTSSALASLTVLKKICDHPALLSESVQETILEVQANCDDPRRITQSIEEMRNSTEWKNVLKELHTSEVRASCKSIFVLNLLDVLIADDHRTLVFSQSKVMLNILESAIISKGWKYLRIDGSVSSSERQNRVNQFQNDDTIPVFLLTSHVGGLGLTLTGADRVVIVDPSWNPSVDSQSVDRAYRIGQKRDVLVYRLISCGTIEDKIYRKQVFKGALFKAGTEQGEQLRYFSLSDLKDLFRLDAEEALHSSTHKRLEELHGHQRELSDAMAQEIDALQSVEHFVGVSDHDLLYSTKKTIPEDLLSKAKVFRPLGSGLQDSSGHAAPSKPKAKPILWEGDDQLSVMFDKALSLEAQDRTQDAKYKLEKELEKQRKLMNNQALISTLPDRGEKIVTRIKQLEMELQNMGTRDTSLHCDEQSLSKSSTSNNSFGSSGSDILERVQTEIEESNSPSKIALHASGKTTTKEEKRIMLKHVVKRKKKELYMKALDLERAMEGHKENEDNINILKKEVEALLGAFIDAKGVLDDFLKES